MAMTGSGTAGAEEREAVAHWFDDHLTFEHFVHWDNEQFAAAFMPLLDAARAEAEIQALRDAADRIERLVQDAPGDDDEGMESAVAYLRDRADWLTRRRAAPPSGGRERGKSGCCTSCEGTGAEIGGPCWDCRGTGHPHPDPESCPEGRAETGEQR